MPDPVGFLISWLILGVAGHLYFGPRWAIDGTRDIIAVYARLWRAVRRR